MNEGPREIINTGRVIVYIDDVCTFTNTAEEHMMLLDKVLLSLRHIGLHIDLKKCLCHPEDRICGCNCF